ncbi:MAG: LL-diaminopimelate aminotransferase [Opitutales bacterium]|nr:LL-diaminopimelate aminotransferase [Opitutales bacterium]
MPKLNSHYGKLQASYLFAEIAKRVEEYSTQNPEKSIIRLGIGDVTEPLPAACVEALKEAADELSKRETFKGYPSYEGYAFLRNPIAQQDFQDLGAEVYADEIFVSDGAKSDTANIQEIFAEDNRIAVPDPVYPVYVDSNVMAGRTGLAESGRYEGLVYLECTPENNYLPELPQEKVDLIYLCFPNNPTGAHISREKLTEWVNYALAENAIIFYDAAYVAFIRDESMPKSIYEIPGARKCAIEFRSFSKNAGFTGTRCAYTVIPKELQVGGKSLHQMWFRRQATKFNGVSYPVQKAAAAVYSEAGQAQVKTLTDFYLGNARIVRESLNGFGLKCTGGDNSPYIWVQVNGASWDFFDKLLHNAGVVCTPGAGFGKCGEGHIRISAFNSRANVLKAMERLQKVF